MRADPIQVKDIMANLVMEVEIKGTTGHRLRVTVATFLIRLAARTLRVRVLLKEAD